MIAIKKLKAELDNKRDSLLYLTARRSAYPDELLRPEKRQWEGEIQKLDGLRQEAAGHS